jgi:hypothetical protein
MPSVSRHRRALEGKFPRNGVCRRASVELATAAWYGLSPKRGRVYRRGLRLGGYEAGELIQRAAQSKRAGSSVVSTPMREPPRRPASCRNRAGVVRQIRTNASAPTPESFKSTAGSAGRTSRNTPGLCEDAPKLRRSRPSSGRCRLGKRHLRQCLRAARRREGGLGQWLRRARP